MGLGAPGAWAEVGARLAPQGRRDKAPQTEPPKAREMDRLTAPEARCPSLRCPASCAGRPASPRLEGGCVLRGLTIPCPIPPVIRSPFALG